MHLPHHERFHTLPARLAHVPVAARPAELVAADEAPAYAKRAKEESVMSQHAFSSGQQLCSTLGKQAHRAPPFTRLDGVLGRDLLDLVLVVDQGSIVLREPRLERSFFSCGGRLFFL